MTATLGGETPMVTGPNGAVITATVTAATFAGPKNTAAAPEGVAAADWPLVRADGTIVLDVRANMRTDDGAEYQIYALK